MINMFRSDGRNSSYGPLADAIRYRVQHGAYRIKRVLIVDDSKDVAHGLKEFLTNHLGLNVGVVISSGRAYHYLRRALREGKPFQLIISDVELGTRSDDGFLILTKARQLDPRIRTILTSSMASTTIHPCEHADFTLHKGKKDMLTELLLLIDRLEARFHMKEMQPLVEPPRG